MLPKNEVTTGELKKRYQRADLQINCLADLKEFGVLPLTGEACPYYQRILSDVTEQGKTLLEQYLGTTLTAEPMNTICSSGKHVASIMFPRAMWTDFADFAAWQEGFNFLVIAGSSHQRNYYREIDADLLDYYQSIGGYQVSHRPRSGQEIRNGAHVAMITGRAGNE